MRVVGIGFPIGFPIPTAVSACGDGVHVVYAPRRGRSTQCRCRAVYATPHPYLSESLPDRIVIAGQYLDDLTDDNAKGCRYEDGTARWAGVGA